MPTPPLGGVLPGSVDTHTFGIEVALISDIFYYHQDEQMTVLGLTNESGALVQGYTYGAYGNATIYYPGTDGEVTWNGADDVMRWNIDTALDVGNPYTYTGRSLDAETGLLYHRARYLDPELGRFITGDKIGVWGDPNNLGNKYAYCNNNPTECSDPTGEWGWLKKAAKAAQKAAAKVARVTTDVAKNVGANLGSGEFWKCLGGSVASNGIAIGGAAAINPTLGAVAASTAVIGGAAVCWNDHEISRNECMGMKAAMIVSSVAAESVAAASGVAAERIGSGMVTGMAGAAVTSPLCNPAIKEKVLDTVDPAGVVH